MHSAKQSLLLTLFAAAASLDQYNVRLKERPLANSVISFAKTPPFTYIGF